MIDGPGGQEQLGGDLGVAVPGADQPEHLALAPGQPERMARVALRGPAGIERMPSRRIVCRVGWTAATAPRPVKIVSAWRSAASSAASCRASAASYGQPRAAPSRDCFLPLACYLQPVGPGQLTARRPGRTSAPQPDSGLAAVPSVRAGRDIIGPFGLLRGPVRLALQPARLGAGQPHRNDPLWLTGGVRGRRCLVEILPGTRLATPGPGAAPSACSASGPV